MRHHLLRHLPTRDGLARSSRRRRELLLDFAIVFGNQLFGLFGGTGAARAAQVPFDFPATATSGGNGIASVDAGDLVAAAYFDNEIVWFENFGGPNPSLIPHTVATGIQGAYAVSVADLDGDGDLDVLANAYAGDTFTWHENNGERTVTDVAQKTIAGSQVGDLLRLDLVHRGRAGDSELLLLDVTVLLRDDVGDPLTLGEAQALFDNVRLHLDDGDGVFDPDLDAVVESVDSGLVLENRTVDDTVVCEAGTTITVGDAFGVGGTGDLTLRAGQGIRFVTGLGRRRWCAHRRDRPRPRALVSESSATSAAQPPGSAAVRSDAPKALGAARNQLGRGMVFHHSLA